MKEDQLIIDQWTSEFRKAAVREFVEELTRHSAASLPSIAGPNITARCTPL
jgi:hypothetical protein